MLTALLMYNDFGYVVQKTKRKRRRKKNGNILQNAKVLRQYWHKMRLFLANMYIDSCIYSLNIYVRVGNFFSIRTSITIGQNMKHSSLEIQQSSFLSKIQNRISEKTGKKIILLYGLWIQLFKSSKISFEFLKYCHTFCVNVSSEIERKINF